LKRIEFFNFFVSENYIKRTGIILLGMSLKKLTKLKNLDMALDIVKKPNTANRRALKFSRGEQRMQLETLMNNESKPLKIIFKKIAKFNKSLKELKKYIYETIPPDEESTLKRYVALNSNKDTASSGNPSELTKETLMKYLSELMESGARAY